MACQDASSFCLFDHRRALGCSQGANTMRLFRCAREGQPISAMLSRSSFLSVSSTCASATKLLIFDASANVMPPEQIAESATANNQEPFQDLSSCICSFCSTPETSRFEQHEGKEKSGGCTLCTPSCPPRARPHSTGLPSSTASAPNANACTAQRMQASPER